MSRVTRIGDEAEVRVETPHPAPAGEAGAPVWQDLFKWENASYIALHFARFDLAPGEKVVIETPDGKRSYSFEGEGKPQSGGTFWATHVPGDTCVVTYYANGGKPGYGYVVDKFAHGYPAPERPEEGIEAICGADEADWARCYRQTEPTIYDLSRAVARLTINGIAACTGWLVGCQGHLMTNNHCIQTPVDALNTDYEFMAEGATCATSCATFGGCPGVIGASMGTLIKTDPPRDYSFVQLPAALAETYGYFKLRGSGAAVGERIYISGHPAAWGKQFAVDSTAAQDESGKCEVFSLNEEACQPLGPSDVGYFCDTQNGSSGSPVIGYSDHRVVALHHCGACPNRGVPIQEVIDHIGVDLPACALQQPAGRVQFDDPSYLCERDADIRVYDDNIAGAGSRTVLLTSPGEPSGETATLLEEPPGSGIFTGRIALTRNPSTTGDRHLMVSHGDTITVEYIDADDGMGGIGVSRTDTATISCLASVAYVSHTFADSCAGTGAGHGNGAIDPGEDTAVPVTLRNDGTASAAGVVAVLSTTTPGVTVTQPTVSYPDIPAGMTATGLSSPFSFVVAPGVGCGIDIDFTLDVSSSEGAFSDTFSVKVGSLGVTTADIPSSDVPKPILDTLTTTSTIMVADTATVADVNVRLTITHTYDEDLDIFLIGPNGVRVELSTDNGGSGDNYTNTVFDDEAATSIVAGTAPFAGTFRPEGSLAALDGIPANGTWTLEMTDDVLQDNGVLTAWSLTLTTVSGFLCDDCALAAPVESPDDLVWSPGDDEALEWDPAQMASYYNLYRGVASDLPNLLNTELDSCRRATTTQLTSGPVLTEVPAEGELFWYLVVSANAAGEGPAGDATAGPRILNSSGACP